MPDGWHRSSIGLLCLAIKFGTGGLFDTSDGNIGVCSTLTTLPLSRSVTPQEAFALFERSVMGRLEIIKLDKADYRAALAKVVECGLTSGIISQF